MRTIDIDLYFDGDVLIKDSSGQYQDDVFRVFRGENAKEEALKMLDGLTFEVQPSIVYADDGQVLNDYTPRRQAELASILKEIRKAIKEETNFMSLGNWEAKVIWDRETKGINGEFE
jgi:hypothetical protein